jgi:hypothetical protein
MFEQFAQNPAHGIKRQEVGQALSNDPFCLPVAHLSALHAHCEHYFRWRGTTLGACVSCPLRWESVGGKFVVGRFVRGSKRLDVVPGIHPPPHLRLQEPRDRQSIDVDASTGRYPS